MLAAPVSTEGTFRPGAPRELFLGPYEGLLGGQGDPSYDVSADGRRFLLVQSPQLQETQPTLGMILNWRPARP
ncbi:MAG: hypothetical protein ACE5ID_12020 [Acidobacteriota bacterium]